MQLASTLIPSSWNLATILLFDLDPKLREVAAQTMAAIFDGAKSLLLVVQLQDIVRSSTLQQGKGHLIGSGRGIINRGIKGKVQAKQQQNIDSLNENPLQISEQQSSSQSVFQPPIISKFFSIIEPFQPIPISDMQQTIHSFTSASENTGNTIVAACSSLLLCSDTEKDSQVVSVALQALGILMLNLHHTHKDASYSLVIGKLAVLCKRILYGVSQSKQGSDQIEIPDDIVLASVFTILGAIARVRFAKLNRGQSQIHSNVQQQSKLSISTNIPEKSKSNIDIYEEDDEDNNDPLRTSEKQNPQNNRFNKFTKYLITPQLKSLEHQTENSKEEINSSEEEQQFTSYNLKRLPEIESFFLEEDPVPQIWKAIVSVPSIDQKEQKNEEKILEIKSPSDDSQEFHLSLIDFTVRLLHHFICSPEQKIETHSESELKTQQSEQQRQTPYRSWKDRQKDKQKQQIGEKENEKNEDQTVEKVIEKQEQTEQDKEKDIRRDKEMFYKRRLTLNRDSEGYIFTPSFICEAFDFLACVNERYPECIFARPTTWFMLQQIFLTVFDSFKTLGTNNPIFSLNLRLASFRCIDSLLSAISTSSLIVSTDKYRTLHVSSIQPHYSSSLSFDYFQDYSFSIAPIQYPLSEIPFQLFIWDWFLITLIPQAIHDPSPTMQKSIISLLVWLRSWILDADILLKQDKEDNKYGLTEGIKINPNFLQIPLITFQHRRRDWMIFTVKHLLQRSISEDQSQLLRTECCKVLAALLEYPHFINNIITLDDEQMSNDAEFIQTCIRSLKPACGHEQWQMRSTAYLAISAILRSINALFQPTNTLNEEKDGQLKKETFFTTQDLRSLNRLLLEGLNDQDIIKYNSIRGLGYLARLLLNINYETELQLVEMSCKVQEKNEIENKDLIKSNSFPMFLSSDEIRQLIDGLIYSLIDTQNSSRVIQNSCFALNPILAADVEQIPRFPITHSSLQTSSSSIQSTSQKSSSLNLCSYIESVYLKLCNLIENYDIYKIRIIAVETIMTSISREKLGSIDILSRVYNTFFASIHNIDGEIIQEDEDGNLSEEKQKQLANIKNQQIQRKNQQTRSAGQKLLFSTSLLPSSTTLLPLFPHTILTPSDTESLPSAAAASHSIPFINRQLINEQNAEDLETQKLKKRFHEILVLGVIRLMKEAPPANEQDQQFIFPLLKQFGKEILDVLLLYDHITTDSKINRKGIEKGQTLILGVAKHQGASISPFSLEYEILSQEEIANGLSVLLRMIQGYSPSLPDRITPDLMKEYENRIQIMNKEIQEQKDHSKQDGLENESESQKL
ncbi:MAG: hypothetical protein EZS28_016166 [Streblomastix strix]|uniref:Uncharacterized protein n=1 Tax=Streblomastix strix TaxID=222440 RepID=A0A5J4W041_9EUKA|nr:MAG: hypothetical protein EZS28_016166 [Streblomastix strix]